jgi:hypothetical protein
VSTHQNERQPAATRTVIFANGPDTHARLELCDRVAKALGWQVVARHHDASDAPARDLPGYAAALASITDQQASILLVPDRVCLHPERQVRYLEYLPDAHSRGARFEYAEDHLHQLDGA